MHRLSGFFRLSFLILICIFFEFNAFGDVVYFPESMEEWIRVCRGRPTCKGRYEEFVPVKGAKVAFLNRPALERDFPILKDLSQGLSEDLSDDELRTWIIQQFGFVSPTQTLLDQIRQTEIPLQPTVKRKKGFRPSFGRRSAVFPAYFQSEKREIGLIDLKGIGHPAAETLDQGDTPWRQISQHRHWKANAENEKNDALLNNYSTDGLVSLREAFAEVLRGEGLQKSFDSYNRDHGTHFQSVEHYFIIAFPFHIIRPNGERQRAALIGRQPSIGRVYHSSSRMPRINPFPDSIYIDPQGGKQTDFFGNAVDMGSVYLTAPEFGTQFFSEKQKALLNKRSKLKPADFTMELSPVWVQSQKVVEEYEAAGNRGGKTLDVWISKVVGQRTVATERSLDHLISGLVSAKNHSSPEISLGVSDFLEGYPANGLGSLGARLQEQGNFDLISDLLGNDGLPGLGIAFSLFEETLRMGSSESREVAAHQLAGIGDPLVSVLWERVLLDEALSVRISALRGLHRFANDLSNPTHLKLFRIALTDPALDPLLSTFGDFSQDLRSEAIAYCQILAKDFTRRLIMTGLLKDESFGATGPLQECLRGH